MPDDKLEKYIKIDAKTGQPGYIVEKEGQDIAGIAKDKDLCGISFEDVKISIVEKDKEGQPKQTLVPGFEFNCKSTKDCKEKNKHLTDKRKEIDQKIKTATPKGYKEKLEEYAGELEKAMKSACALRIVGMPGADVPKFERGNRATAEELLTKKVLNLFCLCEKVEVPKEPEPPKPPKPPPKKPKDK